MIFEALHKYNGKEDVPLSLTQIKQIAGRAGRYGMQRTTNPTEEDSDAAAPDESPALAGSVTTLHKADLPLLKALLPQPLPPITRATLDIPMTTIQALSSLLAPETTFAQLLEQASQLAVLPPKMTLTENRHRTQLSDVVEPLRDFLTLSEMETFSFAPVNQRDPRSVAVFEKVVLAYAKQGRVDLLECYTGSGLIKALEMVEATLDTLPPLPPIEGIGRRLLTPPVIVTSIPSLETLHKTLVMYIWLSFRFDVAFPDRPLAVEIKERVEVVLDQCLARLPGLRTKKTHERGAKNDGIVKQWRREHVGPTGVKRELDYKAIRFDKKRGKLPGQKSGSGIEYASAGEDAGRKRRALWKNIGMVREDSGEK
jgi:ATP-dependent RNA helicase SUPV3L1/SUV3